MELNQIRYFVELARTLHFTRAPEACNVTRPALTRAIHEPAAECLLVHEHAACPARRFIAVTLPLNNMSPRRQHFANSLFQILEMVRAPLGVPVAGERLAAVAPLMRRLIDAVPDTRTVMLAAVAGQMVPTAARFMNLMRARAWSIDAPANAEAA